MFTCVNLQVVTVGCHRISQHPQFDSRFDGFVLHELFKPKTTLEWHHCLIHRDMLMWHLLILKVLTHSVQNISNFVQFVGSVDGIPWVYKVEVSTDLKESVSTHDISKSSVEEAYPLGASSGHLCPVWWCPSWWQGRSTPSTHPPSTFSSLPCCQGHFPFFFLRSHLQNLPDLERFVLCRKGWNSPTVWLAHQEHGRTWMPRIHWAIVILCWWNIIYTCPFKSRASVIKQRQILIIKLFTTVTVMVIHKSC